jgi:HEPN domain-containing protein
VSDVTFGFHYQQTTEKLLKALLAERNVDASRTQDLVRLLELTRFLG